MIRHDSIINSSFLSEIQYTIRREKKWIVQGTIPNLNKRNFGPKKSVSAATNIDKIKTLNNADVAQTANKSPAETHLNREAARTILKKDFDSNSHKSQYRQEISMQNKPRQLL